MGETVTLELPADVARRVREVAQRTGRTPEAILVEWIDRAAMESPVETLSNEDVLALCDAQLSQGTQAELSELLAANREGALDADTRAHLDELMQVYRRGLVRKAQALQVAVERGLRAPLN